MIKTYSAGIVTAYGAAKRAGYTGTYEDFCRQQAGYAENAAAVEQAKTDAINAKNDAVTAKNTAVSAKDDAVSAKNDAVSAKNTATTKAQEASQSATSAGQSATSAGQSATSAEASARASAQSADDAEQSAQSVYGSLAQIQTNKEDIDTLKADLDSQLNLFEVKNELTWTAGYITSTGGIHTQTNSYQYYSERISGEKFNKISIKSNSSTRKIATVLYSKESGEFISRSEWNDAQTLTNEYSVILMVALTTTSATEVDIDDHLEEISILKSYALDDSAIIANNIVAESVYVQDGGASAAASSDLHYVKATSIDLKTGDTITAKTGYEFAVYTSGHSLVSGGWKTSYTLASNYTAAIIVVRRTGKNGLIHKETDGLTLLSYIQENYQSVSNRAFIISSDAVADLKSRLNIDSKWKEKKAAFLGDSITYGTHTTKAYHAILNDMLGFSDIYVDGVAGSGFCTAGSGGHTPIVDRTANIPTDCELIVIFAGTNDFGHGAPLGTISDSTDISFYGAIVKTITDIVTAMPTARLVFMTPLHRSGTTYMGEDDVNTEGLVLSDYVTALKKVAELYSIPIIDLYSISGLTPRIPAIKTGYMSDGLHPDTAGHVLLADRIAARLETM